MPQLTTAVPAYRLHKASGQAVVTLSGQDHYLGPWQSPASKAAYDRLIGEWIVAGRTSVRPADSPGLAIAELLLAYLNEAEATYLKNGEPTSHLHNIQDAVRPLDELYGKESVAAFGPLKLKALRERFIRQGLCRSTINKHIGAIKRVFRWGTENEMVPAGVYHALQAVAGLRRGRSAAPEGRAVKPVPEAYIAAVLPHVAAEVAAMIRLQQITGMRPGEVTIMPGCDLDTSGSVWTYTPATHKTEHHEIQRTIYLGPKAQQIIRPFLKTDMLAYLFDPRQAEALRNAAKRAQRRTPMTPSQRKRRRKAKPIVAPGDHYTTASYRRAISRGCQKADKAAHEAQSEIPAEKILVPDWHPHQLRHNAATLLRKEFGLEAARVVLGHRSAAVTEVYAEMDRNKASSVMGRVG